MFFRCVEKKKPAVAKAMAGEVGMTGLEPAASSSRTKRATGLRYIPFGAAKLMLSSKFYKGLFWESYQQMLHNTVLYNILQPHCAIRNDNHTIRSPSPTGF